MDRAEIITSSDTVKFYIHIAIVALQESRHTRTYLGIISTVHNVLLDN